MRSRIPGSRGDRPSDVDRLVRRIVRDAALTGGAPSDARKVLFDREVDGCRIIVVRERRPTLRLSPREQEIARLVSEGYPTKTIARVLDISKWTVSTYLRRLFVKVGVRSRLAMVDRLKRDGTLRE